MFKPVIKFFQNVVVMTVTGVMFLIGTIAGYNFEDYRSVYVKNVESLTFLENDMETALPQTEVYNIIKDHLTGELPAGKTEKKAIVIGYDGCRLDALTLIGDERPSAVNTLLEDGGKAYVSYCGGRNYPALNTQFTSTAPGWCSMLTGVWATKHGVIDNGMPKDNRTLTLLTTLVEDGAIDGSAFYVSWDGHFADDDSTYKNELAYIREKGLNVNFTDAGGDDGTLENVLTDLRQADCTDFIFTILEYTDHTGHDTGFCIRNPEYEQAFYDAEATASEIIKAVKARETYDTEDWLILITPDHGGYNTWHGMCTLQERMTFIITNKDFAPSGGKNALGC